MAEDNNKKNTFTHEGNPKTQLKASPFGFKKRLLGLFPLAGADLETRAGQPTLPPRLQP